jgi:hypothetical protein
VTIRRGETWGSEGALADDAPVLEDDAAAARVLQAAFELGAPLPDIGLVGGDLHRTLGAPRHDAQDLRDGRGMRFPIDLGVLEQDDAPPRLFVAHLIAHSSGSDTLWRGRTVAVMNAAFLGSANLGPRGHPNDGRLDVTDGALRWGDRRAAARRAPSGAHVPHPDLHERRVKELAVESAAPMRLVLDGVPVASASRWRVRCLADAVHVVV